MFLSEAMEMSSLVLVHYYYLTAVVASLVLTHLLCIFYSSTFQWEDFYKNVFATAKVYNGKTVCCKAVACFGCITASLLGRISTKSGCMLICWCAMPQLYRTKGGQNLRVILGPLTLILALNNVTVADPLTLVGGVVSFSAFCVFRPDNTSVARILQLSIADAKLRRRLHGILATSNALLALVQWILLECTTAEPPFDGSDMTIS